MRLIGLLHQGAEQAGELGEFAGEDGLAEFHIADDALARVGQRPIGSGCEQTVGHRGEMRGRGEREFVLALEVMEEAALGQAGGVADVVDRRRSVSLAADHPQGGVEDLCLRLVMGLRVRHKSDDTD